MNTDPTRAAIVDTVELAVAIADAAVRSDIELYAFGFRRGDHNWFCLDKAAADHPDDEDRALQIVEDAMQYIELRGDVFPWTVEVMLNDDGHRCVRFVTKEAQS